MTNNSDNLSDHIRDGESWNKKFDGDRDAEWQKTVDETLTRSLQILQAKLDFIEKYRVPINQHGRFEAPYWSCAALKREDDDPWESMDNAVNRWKLAEATSIARAVAKDMGSWEHIEKVESDYERGWNVPFAEVDGKWHKMRMTVTRTSVCSVEPVLDDHGAQVMETVTIPQMVDVTITRPKVRTVCKPLLED